MDAYDKFRPSRTQKRNLPAENIPQPTAQDLYKVMIDEQISPALRRLGLTGSGGRYELPSPSHWALLGFQKSTYSNRHAIHFTVNLTAVARETWASRPDRGERPAAGTHYGDDVLTVRIGPVAGREDSWWEIASGADTAATASEVLADIERSGLPWLRKQLAEAS